MMWIGSYDCCALCTRGTMEIITKSAFFFDERVCHAMSRHIMMSFHQ
jgi:hypothetical protein